MNLLAFSTLACPGWSVETVIQKAVEFGYEGIEWRGGPQGHIPPDISSGARAELRTMAEDAGLAALAITAYTSFVSPLEQERNSSVDELRRYSDLAADLGAPYVRAFLGELPPSTNPDEEIYARISECLNTAAAYAASVGVKIAVEPHDDFVRSESVSPLFDREVAHPDLRVIWDIGNTFASGEKPEEGFNLLKDHLAYVQVKDGRKAGSTWQLSPIGEGNVPLEEALALLSSFGYEGALSVEWEYAWHPELDPPEIALPSAIKVIRNLLSIVQSESA